MPEEAVIKNVVWSVRDERIARIDQRGLVTALGEGETMVDVRALDAAVKNEIKITVRAPITSLESEFHSYSLYPNPVVSGVLYIELPDSLPRVHYAFTDVQGRQLKFGVLHQADSAHLIHVADLKKGLYILHLITELADYRYKVLIE
jgi:hypothetical protein